MRLKDAIIGLTLATGISTVSCEHDPTCKELQDEIQIAANKAAFCKKGATKESAEEIECFTEAKNRESEYRSKFLNKDCK